MESLGYASFREFAKDFTEMFTFQNDNNDVFIKTNNWEPGESAVRAERADSHPADGFFGTKNIVLNDDIIEMSQQSLYALTKVLGNDLTVQAMKQQIYLSWLFMQLYIVTFLSFVSIFILSVKVCIYIILSHSKPPRHF